MTGNIIAGLGLAGIAVISYLGYKEYKSREPVQLVNQINIPLPVANQNILTTDIKPTRQSSWFVIQVSASVTGIFSAIITTSSGSVPFIYDDGATIPANSGRIYYLQVYKDESINFQFSGTGGNINNLSVTEIYQI